MGPLWRYGDLGVLDGSARCNMALGRALDDVMWALRGVAQTLGFPTGIPWHYMVLVSAIWTLGGVLGFGLCHIGPAGRYRAAGAIIQPWAVI